MAAEFRIDVVIDPKRVQSGAGKVRNELKQTEGAADKLQRQFKTLFAGLGVAFAVRELGRIADAFTNVQNRVRTVTDGQEELTSVTQSLFDIANETRLAFDATAEVYTRTALAVKDLGISQQQTLEFTKSLNQAVVLSGASATEAQAGLIQLSQGLASGALRGDELRSVLEQLPVVADVISKSLGITRGELRELGSEGKITADVVLRAFKEARVELEERFAESVPTLGQAFTVLTNNLTEFVGAADQATGVSATLSGFIILIANNVDIAIIGIIALSAGIAVAYIPATVSATTATVAFGAALKSVSLLLFANPFGIAVAGIVAAGGAVSIFADKMIEAEVASLRATEAAEKFALTDFGKVGADILRVQENLLRVQKQIDADVASGNTGITSATKTADRYRAQLKALTGQQQALADGTAKSADEARAQQVALEATAKSVQDVIDTIADENLLLGENAREREISIALLREVARIEKERGIGAVTEAQRLELRASIEANAELSRRADVLERIQGPQAEFEADLRVLKQLLDDGTIELSEFDTEVANLASGLEGIDLSQIGGLEGVDAGVLDRLNAQIEAVRQRAIAEQEAQRIERERAAVLLEIQGPLQGLLDRQAIINDLRASGAITQDQANEALAENEEIIRRLNPEYDRQAQILELIRGPQEDFNLNQDALNELLREGKISAEEYAIALGKISPETEKINTAQAGFASGFDQSLESLRDISGAAEDLAIGGFQGLEDSLVSLATTGEADFRRLADSIIADIARIAIRQAISGLFPGGGGGGGLPGLLGFAAHGGPIEPDTPTVVGEEGPEIITTSSAGQVIPAGETAAMLQGAGAPVVNVSAPPATVQVVNVSDPNEIPAGIESNEGRQSVMNVIRQERQTVKDMIS